jgi:class 3 adenylate cyclase
MIKPVVNKTSLSSTTILITWLLTTILPIVAATIGLTLFKEWYSKYLVSQKIRQTHRNIEQFENITRPEIALQPMIQIVKNYAEQNTKFTPKELFTHIESNIEIKPIFILLRSKHSTITVFKNKPKDISNAILPSGVLFKSYFDFLQKLENQDFLTTKNKKYIQKNKRHIQRLFRTLTPVTLLKNQTSKNYSFYLGGELYLQLIRFKGEHTYTHCLLVTRGKEISTNFLISQARRKFPECHVRLKKTNPDLFLKKQDFFSRTIETNSHLIVTKPAHQNFIRHYLHSGGIMLTHSPSRIPFVLAKIKKSDLTKSLTNFQIWFSFLAKIFVLISVAFIVRAMIFGIEFSDSLQKKVIGALVLVSLFPFSAMIASLYFYQTYDSFNFKLNLHKHIETEIKENFEEIQQSLAFLETFMASNPEITRQFNNINKVKFNRLASKLSKKLPFSDLSYISLNAKYNYSIPERQAIFEFNHEDPVLSYAPKKILQLLKEDKILSRTAQHMFYIQNKPIKISFLGNNMQSMGSFRLFNQGTIPIWFSATHIPKKNASGREIEAILSFKYDLGPILKRHYDKKKSFSQQYKNATIEYGYFPLTRMSDNDYWKGSFSQAKSSLFQDFFHTNQQQTISFSNNEQEKTVFIRTHQNLPHKAIAIVSMPSIDSTFQWKNFALLALLYMIAVFLLVSRLLEIFLIEPVEKMAESAEKIARGSEKWALKINSGDELSQLNGNFSSMVMSLKQRNLLKDYVSKDAFSDISSQSGSQLFPGGEFQELTIVFVSFKEYATLLENPDIKETINVMNRFITLCDETCSKYKATIDKITEGTVMIVYRKLDSSDKTHCIRATKGTLELKEKAEGSGLSILSGMASGKVISGRIGSYKGKLDFTVIGDTVNLAARLKNEAYKSNSGIIIAGSSMRMLKGKARVKFLRRAHIKGKSREFNIYEMIGLRE